MKTMSRIVHRAGIMALLAVGLALGACAKNQATDSLASGANGVATPGSQQDFVVNVGDRVFFETDQTDLTPQARSTLKKQSQFLHKNGNHTFTIEGRAAERGTR